MANHLILPAIRVSQPLGDFWITKFKASELLDLTYSSPARMARTTGDAIGSQRELKETRVKEIARYIDTVECAFPNSIIIAANYKENGTLCEDDSLRWKVNFQIQGCSELIIPSKEKLAAIIDGQHRLNGFRLSDFKRLDTELLCAVYLDLPNPYQAYLFATINFNQRKVDRSLAFDLFGYNLEEEPSESWSPDKLAVYLSRKLNFEESPFSNHILVASQDDQLLSETSPRQQKWYVSAATVIDGIMSLYSKNPSLDRDTMHRYLLGEERNRQKLLSNDGTPLRELYISNNDAVIYKSIYNYFAVVSKQLFEIAPKSSYIFKTVGLQALFDVLREILPKAISQKDISEAFFENYIHKLRKIDFSDIFYQTSAVGRNRLKNTMLFAMGLINEDSLKAEDLKHISRILNGGIY